MVYMLVQHKVEDYDKWRAVFDDKADLRQASGETSALVLRQADDPNAMVLLFGWDSLERAQAYLQNPMLKEAMQEAGVITPPQALFLTAA